MPATETRPALTETQAAAEARRLFTRRPTRKGVAKMVNGKPTVGFRTTVGFVALGSGSTWEQAIAIALRQSHT